ncbi:hypothetical protein PT2222_160110 [Paraburkholderia tropica]
MHINRVSSQQRTQHPRGLFMRLHALREQVGGRLVVGGFRCREDRARGAHHGFLAFHELADHVFGGRHSVGFRNRRELREVLVAARRVHAQRADALGDRVDGQRQFVVLPFEHQVQRIEHRTRDVPVEVVRLQIQRVGVREQARKTVRDLLAILVADADIHVLHSRFLGHDDSYL